MVTTTVDGWENLFKYTQLTYCGNMMKQSGNAVAGNSHEIESLFVSTAKSQSS